MCRDGSVGGSPSTASANFRISRTSSLKSCASHDLKMARPILSRAASTMSIIALPLHVMTASRTRPSQAIPRRIVIDYLWGKSAERLLIAAAKASEDGVPLRFVQIGSISGQNITLPSAVLRASAIQLIGSGIGSVPRDRLIGVVGDLLQSVIPAGLKIATRPTPLSQVEDAWSLTDSTQRTVLMVSV